MPSSATWFSSSRGAVTTCELSNEGLCALKQLLPPGLFDFLTEDNTASRYYACLSTVIQHAARHETAGLGLPSGHPFLALLAFLPGHEAFAWGNACIEPRKAQSSEAPLLLALKRRLGLPYLAAMVEHWKSAAPDQKAEPTVVRDILSHALLMHGHEPETMLYLLETFKLQENWVAGLVLRSCWHHDSMKFLLPLSGKEVLSRRLVDGEAADLSWLDRAREALSDLRYRAGDEHEASDARGRASALDGGGRLPLHSVLMNRPTVEAVEMLLHAGYDDACEKRDRSGRLPLHYAADAGCSWPVCSLLIEHFPGALSTLDRDGNTPLHLALQLLGTGKPKAQGEYYEKIVAPTNNFEANLHPSQRLDLAAAARIAARLLVATVSKMPATPRGTPPTSTKLAALLQSPVAGSVVSDTREAGSPLTVADAVTAGVCDYAWERRGHLVACRHRVQMERRRMMEEATKEQQT